MAGKKPTKDEIKAMISVYLAQKTQAGINIESSYNEDIDTYFLKDANGIESKIGPGWNVENDALKEELYKILQPIIDARDEPTKGSNLPAKRVQANINRSEPRSGQGRSLVRSDVPIRDVQVQELTMQDIKDYVCPEANDSEAFMFLKLCQARNLNPFTREAYLVKYGGKANMIVGKEAFTRKAEQNPQFDGFRAGIITDDGVCKEGSFLGEGQKLLGGWAEVYRKDRKVPFRMEVSLKEYTKGQATWKDMPAVMIRKVALVSALREAFPSDLSGCYDASEISVEIKEAT
jgi:phage recombination protein Bet